MSGGGELEGSAGRYKKLWEKAKPLLSALADVDCSFEYLRRSDTETCPEAHSRMQGAPMPGCYKCAARALVKASEKEGDGS